MVIYTYKPQLSKGGGTETRSSSFKARLGYRKPCFKKVKNKKLGGKREGAVLWNRIFV